MLEIRDGRLVSARCERADLERDFWNYCHTDENSDRVGELAFGTNLGLREMIGILLQDEKVPGVHLAFGDPYGSQTHADWKSRTHVDVLTRDCDVWIDDEQVIADGSVSARPVRPGYLQSRSTADRAHHREMYSRSCSFQYGQSWPPRWPQSSR